MNLSVITHVYIFGILMNDKQTRIFIVRGAFCLSIYHEICTAIIIFRGKTIPLTKFAAKTLG